MRGQVIEEQYDPHKYFGKSQDIEEQKEQRVDMYVGNLPFDVSLFDS